MKERINIKSAKGLLLKIIAILFALGIIGGIIGGVFSMCKYFTNYFN